MVKQLTDAQVIVNNETQAIVPGSLTWDDGLGEHTVRAMSVGGGKASNLSSMDIATMKGTVSFDLPTTVNNVAAVRRWRQNGDQNVVQISGQDSQGRFTRNFRFAVLTGSVENAVGAETNISLTWESETATN